MFAIFADAPWTAAQREFFPPLIHELAQQLAERGMPIRAGWIVGPHHSPSPKTASYGPEVPLEAVQSSCINVELVFRGSQVQDRFAVALLRGHSRTAYDAGNHRRRRLAPSLRANHARSPTSVDAAV